MKNLRQYALELFLLINNANMPPEQESQAISAAVDLCMALGCTQSQIEQYGCTGE